MFEWYSMAADLWVSYALVVVVSAGVVVGVVIGVLLVALDF